ncbi:MAG TPA: DUF4266 domain-containing protein [Rhizomicrobium sp.]|nr:DUF4266 domain-containing protein [Rhizomicrobium sp.]
MAMPTSPRMTGVIRTALLCAAVSLTAGACASLGPKPWQKDLMARKEMQVDAHPLLSEAADHVYFSREASSGGRGFAGGGCGCN